MRPRSSTLLPTGSHSMPPAWAKVCDLRPTPELNASLQHVQGLLSMTLTPVCGMAGTACPRPFAAADAGEDRGRGSERYLLVLDPKHPVERWLGGTAHLGPAAYTVRGQQKTYLIRLYCVRGRTAVRSRDRKQARHLRQRQQRHPHGPCAGLQRQWTVGLDGEGSTGSSHVLTA